MQCSAGDEDSCNLNQRLVRAHLKRTSSEGYAEHEEGTGRWYLISVS